MPVKKEFRQIRVSCSEGEFHLSILNPDFPLFRLHSQDTVIQLSSSFFEFKSVALLPENSLVIKLTRQQYDEIVIVWARGTQFKTTESLPMQIREKVMQLLQIAQDSFLPSKV